MLQRKTLFGSLVNVKTGANRNYPKPYHSESLTVDFVGVFSSSLPVTVYVHVCVPN